MKTARVFLIVFASIIVSFQACGSYRILGIFPVPARSHFIMFSALMKGLAQKGHRVDVVGPFPLKSPYPNYTDITVLPAGFPATTNNLTYEAFTTYSGDILNFLAITAGNDICELIGNPDILELVRNPPKDPPYDVLITELYTTDCFLVLGHVLEIPTVGISSTPLYPWLNSIIGNPRNLAFVPSNLLGYVAPMNFWQRVHNTIHSVYTDLYIHYQRDRQNAIIRKYISGFVPEIRELESNLDLVLVNAHVSVNGARPATSSVVEVGGLHIQTNHDELSKDLKDWLDSSNDGVIYFTFGSMVVIESFPERVIRVLYESFGKINPVGVLMKIEDPNKLPPGLPSNVRTFRWASQFRVLEHNNTKAFITHGGLMGSLEAIHAGVPMIGIPLFIDQFLNVELYATKKIAVKLDHRTITVEELDAALNEILRNPVYRNNVAKLSKEFRDRPMSPMDTAVWWVEYVVRNPNNILRSRSLDLAWWQNQLLDVCLFLLLVAAILVFLAISLARFFIKICVTMFGPKITSTKKID